MCILCSHKIYLVENDTVLGSTKLALIALSCIRYIVEKDSQNPDLVFMNQRLKFMLPRFSANLVRIKHKERFECYGCFVMLGFCDQNKQLWSIKYRHDIFVPMLVIASFLG